MTYPSLICLLFISKAFLYIFNNPQNSACKMLGIIWHMAPLPAESDLAEVTLAPALRHAPIPEGSGTERPSYRPLELRFTLRNNTPELFHLGATVCLLFS